MRSRLRQSSLQGNRGIPSGGNRRECLVFVLSVYAQLHEQILDFLITEVCHDGFEVQWETTLPLGAVFDRWDDREAPAILDLVPEYVFCDVEGLPKDDALVHPGARVALYEVADPQLALDLGARGAELIETFEVGEMIEAFGRIASEA